jgi:misacylated tRNA(Ala) deacylase
MTITTAHYLRDPGARQITATVTDAVVYPHEVRFATDITVFHPTGGGQPSDLGQASWSNGACTATIIEAVQGPDGAIWHKIDGAMLPAVGESVELTIDGDRRDRLTRSHTAAHVVIAVVADSHGAVVTGCDLSETGGRVDFDGLPGGIAEALQDGVDRAVAGEHAIRYEWLPAADAAEDPDLVRTATNRVPSFLQEVRVVVIEDLDRQADGGTHVANTRDIGSIRIQKVENKGKGLRRVRFEVLDG